MQRTFNACRMSPPRALIAALLLSAAHVVSAKQVTAKMGVSATVVYPAIIKTHDNGAVTSEGARSYTVEEKYAEDGIKVIVILY